MWSPEEAIAYLGKSLKDESYAGYSEEKAGELAEELGYLPLALAQAAAYIESIHCTLENYIKRFKNEHDALWKREKPPAHYKEKYTVATTWNLALEQIKTVEGAKELMSICSFLAPEGIPISLLTDHADIFEEPLSSVLKSEIQLDDALGALLSYSLIDKSYSHLSVHRLVQTVVRDGLGEEWLRASVALMEKAFKFHMNKFETWRPSVPLAPHARQIIEHAEGLKEEDLVRLCFSLASYHSNYIVLYNEAEILFKKTIKIGKETTGEEHIDYAKCLNDFALLLNSMGRYKEAEPLYRQAIKIAKVTIGEEHPDYANHLNNLANLLNDMGHYKEAKPLYTQAIRIAKITIDEKYSSYVIYLSNFANLLERMGHYDEAEPLYKQAIEIDKTTIGEAQPEHAKHLNNLALLLNRMGRNKEAEPLYRQAMEIIKTTVGEAHPEYAKQLNNFAGLLNDMKRYDEAEPLYRGCDFKNGLKV